ncbi:DoxX family protein, partial [Streptomyces olivaceus]
ALLALGLATPAAGAAAAGAMAGAAAVHAPNGFFAQSGGYEYAASLGLTAAGLAITGPGRLSLDHALGHAVNRNWMVPAALAATGAATAVIVGARNKRVRKAAEGRQEPLFD